MRLPVCFLFTILIAGCKMNKPEPKIDWFVGGKLPAQNAKTHIGVAGPVTGIIGDVLVVAGGANFPNGMPWEGGIKAYTKEAYFYSIGKQGELDFLQAVPFEDSLAYSAIVSSKNGFYAIGGERKGQATSDVFHYSISNNTLMRKAFPSLPHPLTSGSATEVGDYLYFVGGENADFVSDKVYRLDLKAGESAVWEEFIVIPESLSHAILVTDGESKLLIAGGRKRNVNSKSTIYNAVLELKIDSKEFNEVTQLPESLAAGTGVYYEGNLIIIGGDNAQTFHQVEELIGAINLTIDEVEKQQLIERKNAIQSSHPGFVKDVWVYNLHSKNWRKTDRISANSPVTTTAILHNDIIIIPSGEIRAGVRTDQILMGRIK